jgi:Subtilase family/FG-GAP-like repeat
MRLWRRHLIAVATLAAALALDATAAFGAFPYTRPGGDSRDFTDLYLADQIPGDLCGDGNQFKFAASPDPANSLDNADPVELGGVRGAHLVDGQSSQATSCDGDSPTPPTSASGRLTAFQLTLGRPDVTIAVLDSGIKWNDGEAMDDLRDKVRLDQGELPTPQADLATAISDPSANDCPTYDTSSYDANGDGVFNIEDYACDGRVAAVVSGDGRRVGPSGVLTPQDLIIAFSDRTDGDGNGYIDDIAGWDFLDDDNDPFDDVQYGHGTGEARDSSAEADNGNQLGSCPNCMVAPLRVGDSFIADDNRFGAAVTYATDNGFEVVQEALGTLNNSRLARQAVEYAYRHGVTVVASAADEAAQHNNWPSSLPHVILVNSVRDEDAGAPPPPNRKSYLALNGCTNFNAKVSLAIPSTSCSSNATGLGAGMAGLVYSAALDARAKGALTTYPDRSECVRVNSSPCVVTPNEVRQIMASGTIGGIPRADDVDFAGVKATSSSPPDPATEPSCSPAPAPACTDPNGALQDQVNANRQPAGYPATKSYPARWGHDQFYGWGRANMRRALQALLDDPQTPSASRIPPEAEITSPEWFAQVDPSRPSVQIDGQVFARGHTYSCQLLVAPGHYPNNRLTTQTPPGDFEPLHTGWCDGSTAHTEDHSGSLGSVDIQDLKSRFPPETQATGFTGNESGGGTQTANGRPNTDPYGFVVKVVARSRNSGAIMAGEDERALYLHRDGSMLSGYPRQIGAGGRIVANGKPVSDGESSPVFADLDGDDRNEMVFATSDGYVHAIARGGAELPGWPVRTDTPSFVATHTASAAYASGAVSSSLGGAVLASVAVGDPNADGIPDVFAADLEGNVYGWRASGSLFFHRHSTPAFSGRPLPGHPFENPRYLSGSPEENRVQPGFIASPVLADLNGDGRQEIIAAGMDRHLYAWHADGTAVGGFPVLVVDRSKTESVDGSTHTIKFKSGALQQGPIVDTPAVADIAGDDRPEIVVGTNEEYDEPMNAGNLTTSSFGALGPLLSPGNGRLHAIHSEGRKNAGGPFLNGWPVKIGILSTELLPVVGEGITGGAAVAPVTCPSGGPGPKVGVVPDAGPGYVLNPSGSSCYGNDPTSGRYNALESDFGSGTGYDHPAIPAVGLPAFGDLGGGDPSFLSPAAGAIRSLDVVASDYQGGQDFTAAWNANTGQFRPGFPAQVNDLQFLTGPSVANIDGAAGQEVVEGTSSMDLAAFSAGGAASAGWPKLTTDWTVANPLIGTWGTRDAGTGSKKVIVNFTRSGYINAYGTGAPACSGSSWSRFHHDPANSGDYERDATLPGRPFDADVTPARIAFRAPGDDLLCGAADRYQVVTSDAPISASNFDEATPLSGAPSPAAPGTAQSYSLPAGAKQYVAIRAVDDQGNVGRPLVITP